MVAAMVGRASCVEVWWCGGRGGPGSEGAGQNAAVADCDGAQKMLDCYGDCCDLEEDGATMKDSTALLKTMYDGLYTCTITDPCA